MKPASLDAFDRRRLMLITQTAMAVLAAALAILTFRGLTAVWPIYLLTALGITVGFHRLFTHRAFETNRAVQFSDQANKCYGWQPAQVLADCGNSVGSDL